MRSIATKKYKIENLPKKQYYLITKTLAESTLNSDLK